MGDGCRLCELNASDLPPHERLYVDDAWRVAHGWSSLPGWLIVAARRHVAHLGELTDDEAGGLGRLLRAATQALCDVVGCEKTYVVLFAESDGFRHVHLHVVPRMPDLEHDAQGPRVFRFLDPPEDEQVPVEERARLAAEVGAAIRAELA